jgi:hypothetical protein
MPEDATVKIRLHPGIRLDCGQFESAVGKFEALASAKLVITGVSGFAIESAFCGIPTVILLRPEDKWVRASLAGLRDFPHIHMVDLQLFLATPSEFLQLPGLYGRTLAVLQRKMGYLDEIQEQAFPEFRYNAE